MDKLADAIETIQDMLDVLEKTGRAYVYKHNGGQNRLVNVLEQLKIQSPRKVTDKEHYGRCPSCDGEFNSELQNEYHIEFCPWCGQALDWSEVD